MTDTPAAWWPTQMVSTCGTVMSMVKTDIAPSNRRSIESERELSLAGFIGSGAMGVSLEIGSELAREPGGRHFTASARVLSRPQRRKIPRALRFGLGAQRRDRRGGERKGGDAGAHRPELAHQAVHDAARRAAGDEVGERGVARGVALQRGAVRGTCQRLGAEEIRRADLHAR